MEMPVWDKIGKKDSADAVCAEHWCNESGDHGEAVAQQIAVKHQKTSEDHKTDEDYMTEREQVTDEDARKFIAGL
jgi:hypothetical protein